MSKKYLGLWISLFTLTFTVLTFADSPSERETDALAQWHKTGDLMALHEVATAREELGEFQSARAAWQLLKSRAGNKKPDMPGFGSNTTWAQVADFTDHRLARKMNLTARPATLSSPQRKRIAEGAMRFKQSPPAEQLDLLVQADLDGDLIDELFYIGSNGPLGNRKKNAMGIAKWDGNNYKIVWKNAGRIPFMVHVIDNDGDGWKEIFCGYTPDSDDAATLYFNGSKVIWM